MKNQIIFAIIKTDCAIRKDVIKAMETICGANCSKCNVKETCGGCIKTNGHPLGGTCIIASCCQTKGYQQCYDCSKSVCEYKSQLIKEFNSLKIKDMPKVTELYHLNGAFVNLEYTLPGGQAIKFWKDNNIYLGNQLHKNNSNRCYGLTADDNYLLVCEYGDNGSDPKIVIFKKRTK